MLTDFVAADVSIFASSSKAANPLVGNVENTEVGSFLANYLSLDVNAITKKLQQFSPPSTASNSYGEGEYGWLGDPLGEDILVDGLDSYHGDFKRSVKRNADGEIIERSPCGCGSIH
jgi:alkaline phosphatase